MVLYFIKFVESCNKVIRSPLSAPVPFLFSLLLCLLRLLAHWNAGRREVWFVLRETDVYTPFVRLFISSSPKFTQKENSEGHYCHPKPLGSI